MKAVLQAARSTRRALVLAICIAVSVVPGAAFAGVDDEPTLPPPDTSGIVAVRSGDVIVVDANERSKKLQRGGSATEFSLSPPSGAVCPGDSKNDSWRVQTFIVPVAVDPGSIVYEANGPVGEHQYAMYDTFTQSIVDRLTVANEVAGRPGLIDSLAPMSFAVFPVGELPDGTYRVGVACTYFGATADYWDTELVLTNTPTDKPAQLTWRLVGAPPAAPATGGGFPWRLVAFGSVSVLGIGWLVRARRLRTSTLTLSKDPS